MLLNAIPNDNECNFEQTYDARKPEDGCSRTAIFGYGNDLN